MRLAMFGAQGELARLDGLYAADDPGDAAQGTGFGTVGNMALNRFGIHATVAGAMCGPEYGGLPFKTENGPINDGFAEFDGGIVDEVLGGKVV